MSYHHIPSSSSKRQGAPPKHPDHAPVLSPRAASTSSPAQPLAYGAAGQHADEARLFHRAEPDHASRNDYETGYQSQQYEQQQRQGQADADSPWEQMHTSDSRQPSRDFNHQELMMDSAAAATDFQGQEFAQQDKVARAVRDELLDEVTREALVQDVLSMCLAPDADDTGLNNNSSHLHHSQPAIYQVLSDLVDEAILLLTEDVARKTHAVAYSDYVVATRRRERVVERAQSSVVSVVADEILSDAVMSSMHSIVKTYISELSTEYIYLLRADRLIQEVIRDMYVGIAKEAQAEVVLHDLGLEIIADALGGEIESLCQQCYDDISTTGLEEKDVLSPQTFIFRVDTNLNPK